MFWIAKTTAAAYFIGNANSIEMSSLELCGSSARNESFSPNGKSVPATVTVQKVIVSSSKCLRYVRAEGRGSGSFVNRLKSISRGSRVAIETKRPQVGHSKLLRVLPAI